MELSSFAAAVPVQQQSVDRPTVKCLVGRVVTILPEQLSTYDDAFSGGQREFVTCTIAVLTGDPIRVSLDKNDMPKALEIPIEPGKAYDSWPLFGGPLVKALKPMIGQKKVVTARIKPYITRAGNKAYILSDDDFTVEEREAIARFYDSEEAQVFVRKLQGPSLGGFAAAPFDECPF